VIPVRAGSKRLPEKNLARVGGRTLLERAVHTALGAFGAVTVSTDSALYARVAEDAGAIVPALRPPALATDTATTDAVVQHVLTEWHPDAATVVVVQATSPFTTSADLVAVVEALTRTPRAASALLVTALPAVVAYALAGGADDLATPLAPDCYDRRSQDLPALWLPSGGAFAAPAARVRDGGPLQQAPFAVVPVPEERAIDIDDAADLARARELAA
jgi:N-acylneuraminate cytidylyltransferase